MKYIQHCFILVFLVSVATANAQVNNGKKVMVVIGAFFTNNNSDTLTWQVNRPLQPQDFANESPKDKSGNFPPIGSVAVVYFINHSATGDTVTVCPGTIFLKKHSWLSRQQKKDETVLSFEQMKFDLAKIYELRFAACLRDTSLYSGNVNKAVQNIYQRFYSLMMDEMHAMINDCNTAGDDYYNRLQQWQAKIAAGIKKPGQKV